MKRKARKNYNCDSCDFQIKKGETYESSSVRVPVYGEDGETQTGIEFLRWKSCSSCIEQAEKEKKEWEEFAKTEEFEYQESMIEHKYP